MVEVSSVQHKTERGLSRLLSLSLSRSLSMCIYTYTYTCTYLYLYVYIWTQGTDERGTGPKLDRFPSIQRNGPGRTRRVRKWKTLETLGYTGLMSLICLTTTVIKDNSSFSGARSLALSNEVCTGLNFERHFSDFDPADSIPLTVLVCESSEVFSPGRCKTQARGKWEGSHSWRVSWRVHKLCEEE